MEKWQIFAIIGCLWLVIEIMTPTMFFLNIAIGSFVTAICSVFIDDWDVLIYIWIASSGVLLLTLYPLLIKNRKKNKIETGIDKYIGQKVKVTEKITKESGAVSIFDERWNARIESGKEIAVGSFVTVYKIENLTMYVRKED